MAEKELDKQPQVDAPADAPAEEKPAKKGGKKSESETVRLKGGNCCVDGVEYEADKNGLVDVDEAHAEILVRELGFQRV